MRARHLFMAPAAGVAALLCACGGAAPAPLPAPSYHGSPVPAATDDPVYPEPTYVMAPPFGTPDGLAGVAMENSLSNQIGQDVPVSPACPKPLALAGNKKPETFRCHADWDGVAVPFTVTVTNEGGGYFTVQATQLEGLLVASAVRTAWALRNYAISGPLSCSSDLPAATLVPFGKPTKYLCSDGTSYYSVQLDYNPPCEYTFQQCSTQPPFDFSPVQ
jgi:hypothetical protein